MQDLGVAPCILHDASTHTRGLCDYYVQSLGLGPCMELESLRFVPVYLVLCTRRGGAGLTREQP
jgi:hypothetical protein